MGIVRLYITRLAPETIHSLLTLKVFGDRAVVASISLHAIPPFPEKSYGCLDCEQEAANGMKKELNGSLFRGVKVGVEDGRPDTFVPRSVPSEEVEGEKKKRKRAKKDCDGNRKKAKKKEQGEGCS